jgi:hypothetical protein
MSPPFLKNVLCDLFARHQFPIDRAEFEDRAWEKTQFDPQRLGNGDLPLFRENGIHTNSVGILTSRSSSIVIFSQSRFGHDRRYAIDSSFAQGELKWKPLHNFKEGLEATIDWYKNNRAWWEPLLERTGRH